MSSPDSFQISITSANTSTTATNTTTENTPQKLGDDLRPCLKHKTLLNRNYFKSSSNFSKQVSDCKHEQNFQEQPAYLTKENLQLHNENINLEMKKNLLSLNQPAYNNINLLSRSFPINLQHEKNMTYLGVCNLKNSKHKTNKVSVQSCLPAEKKYENAFDHKSNSIKNKTTDNLCEKLHIENKERNWEENVPPIKNTDYKKENTCEKHLITSCNCNNIYDYDEKTQCSLPHNDSIGRAEQTYLDNTKGYLNACDFHHQKQRKKLNLLKSGFLTNTGVKRDSDILEKNFEVKTNAQKLPVDRKTIAELSDRSHMKALRENYEIKTSDDKSNNNNKNSYYKHEVSRGITVNRERRQHNSDNNNVINADNILIQSSDTCETLKDKAEISLNNNQDIEEYFGIFQLSNNNNQQETLISQRKLDLLKDLSSQKLNTKLRFKPKSVPKIYDNCNKNSNHDYRSFPCVKNLVKMYNKKLEEKKNEKFALNNIANNSDNENTNEMTTENLENRISPVSADEGCQIGRLSCSDSEEAILKSYKKKSDKVIRSSSHDSALGLEEEVAAISFDERRKSIDSIVPIGKSFYKKNILERRNTLTITDIPLRSALLPLPQPVDLPDTTSNTNMENDKEKQQQKTQQQTQNSIPSKVLIEERIVEVPLEMALLNTSRRESAQSCSSEYTNSSEYGAKRYVRTPSVVVSDYSDDVMCGITLEEIEYLRKQRMRRRSSDETATTEKDDALSDVSGASSCSNLYYCGSTISALDGADCYINGIRTKIRKNSDCSICSNSSQASYDEDEEDTGADYNNSEDVFHIENITNNNHERDTQPRKKNIYELQINFKLF